MKTKAQEREILQQIADLIASAGPDSYVGAAFTGCVELARENIENDFCMNFPDRLDRLQHDYGVTSKAVDSMAAEIRALKEERADLQAVLQATRAQKIPAALYKRLWLAVDAQHAEAVHAMNCSADLLADMVNAPGDIAVAQCLKTLAKQKARREEAAALLHDLEKYEPEE